MDGGKKPPLKQPPTPKPHLDPGFYLNRENSQWTNISSTPFDVFESTVALDRVPTPDADACMIM